MKRPIYDGIKFYSVYVWNNEAHWEKAAYILDSFVENKEYTDINRVLELYNIQKLVNGGVTSSIWGNEKSAQYKEMWLSLLISQRKRPDYGICRRI